jgi:hypothetical protein
MSVSDREWEDVVSPNTGDYTERLAVPGGWLYRTCLDGREPDVAVAMVFVPYGRDYPPEIG